MFRSSWCKSWVTLKSTASIIINGESASSSSLTPPAKYFLFSFQNQNVVIINSRVTSIFYSFSTNTCNNNSDLTCSDSSNSFVVSYLINSCGLSQNQAITASEKLNFKTTTKPDSVLTLLTTYGFTESHISKLINKEPSILSSKPVKTLKPKFDFFVSKGLYGLDLGNFILNDPKILWCSLNKGIIPSFDILKTIVQSDQNVVKMIKRHSCILKRSRAKRVLANIEILSNEGVPVTNISKFLINQPRAFTENVNKFKETVEKVKEMGFNHLHTTFLNAMHALRSMTEANWRKKMDVYKRWGWSEDQIQTAFRKNPGCMRASENKIMAVMTFLVNEMGYDSLSIAENPTVLNCSLKERTIPRCSVIKILVSKGFMNGLIALNSLSTMVDKHFCKNFVKNHEQEVPELMKVFQGQMNYLELL